MANMEFLELFTLKDVFIVASGLMVTSIIRIYYASYLEKKKIHNFANSLTIYNTLHETTKIGLLILSSEGDVLFINQETSNLFNSPINTIDHHFLNELLIYDEYNHTKDTFAQKIQQAQNLNNIYI
jgi:hypothetical protein